MKFWPTGIAGRTLLVLLIGFGIAQALTLALYVRSRAEAIAAMEASRAADRIADLLLLAPQPDSAQAAKLGLSLHALSDVPHGAAASGLAPVVAGILRQRLALTSLPPVEVMSAAETPIWPWKERTATGIFRWRESGELMRGRQPPTLVVRALFPDPAGGWLGIDAEIYGDAPVRLWPPRFLFAFTILAVVALVLTVGAVRRVARPLALFTVAAERLGQDLAAPPLPETGPREVRRLTAAFNRMQARLRSFVEGRTQLLAAISHDLRTPLTRLKLRTELVEDEGEQARMVGDIEHMEALITAALTFARNDAAREARHPVDLAGMLADIALERQDLAQNVRYDGPERLILPVAPLALRRAVDNLIDNALKFGHQARITLAMSADSVLLSVQDDGPGIPATERERVFEPFYRGDAARSADIGGSGLGLSITRDIVHAHGGTITLEDAVPSGLLIQIRLPVQRGGGGVPS